MFCHICNHDIRCHHFIAPLGENYNDENYICLGKLNEQMNWQIMEIDVTDYSITSAGRLSMAQAHSSPFTCEQVAYM